LHLWYPGRNEIYLDKRVQTGLLQKNFIVFQASKSKKYTMKEPLSSSVLSKRGFSFAAFLWILVAALGAKPIESFSSSSSSFLSAVAVPWKQQRLPVAARLRFFSYGSTRTARNSLTSNNSNNNPRKSSRISTTTLYFFGGNNNNNEDSATSPILIDYSQIEPQVYPQRWVQLAYLSLLALLSDWVCFAVAAAPSTFENNFGHSAASIIDIFLFTNVVSSFLVTDVVAKIGLQRAIQASAVLMTLGCWFRAGIGFFHGGEDSTAAATLVDYNFLVAGTVMVGMAQPFFQCTPPLLSAKWFANNERATSTAIALNFNQIGIATAFLIGGAMATSTGGLAQYLGLIAVATTLVTIGCLLQFQNEPPLPPSTSELEKKLKGEVEPPFLESVQKFFKTKGFTNALAAFICSIAITNVVGVSRLVYVYGRENAEWKHWRDGIFRLLVPCHSSSGFSLCLDSFLFVFLRRHGLFTYKYTYVPTHLT
jgi:hypothetical protein